MTRHVGIVACSAPGAALCYETLCSEASARLGPYAHPEITLHAFSFAEHVVALEAGDWDAMATLLLRSAEKLATAGASFAICPDNTVHQALDLMLPRSPIPFLHIAEVVAGEAKRRGFRRLGVLGTRYLMEGPVYADKLAVAGIEWRIPESEDRERLQRIIFDELVVSRVTSEAREEARRIIAMLRSEESCDAIVLGCTELPLLVTEGVSSLPTLDSTRLLARAAIEHAVTTG
jgi:aspartate racemase